VKLYSVRIWVLGVVLGVMTGVLDFVSAKIMVTPDVYWGLLFLVSGHCVTTWFEVKWPTQTNGFVVP